MPTFGASPANAPRSGEAKIEPRVIVVGWDGGDWKLLDPMMASGELPNLAALAAKGRTWNLKSYQPMASPLIWTTIATGRTPPDHGVLDFQELEPKTRTRVPISSRSRKVPAIWNVASAKGVSVGVVNWWATWPAERVSGFLVSDRAAPVLFDPLSLSKSPALTWPESIADGVRIVVKREATPGFEDVAKGLAISRAEFDAAVARAQDLNDPITGYQKTLGVTRAAARIALELYDREKPRLLMAYFQGTDEIGHVLGRFHPPKLPTVTDEEFRKYRGAVAALYREADRLLGEFVKRAERDGATLLLLSDHGFKWTENRPAYYSGVQFDTAFLWHEQPGVLVAAGPAVSASKTRAEASVFDVAPTLCRLLGLPADPIWEGKALAGFSAARVPRPVAAATWEKVARVERVVVADRPEDRKAAEEFTKKLISLGYLTGAEATAVDARPPDRAGTETASAFQNVGTFYRDRGDVERSIPWYRKALEVNPNLASAIMNLSTALGQTKKWDESDELMIRALKAGYNDPEAAAYRRIAYYKRLESTGNRQATKQNLAFVKRLVAAFPGNEKYESSLGKLFFESQECAEAERVFRGLLPRRPADVEVLNLLALSTWCQGRLDEARGFFKKSLETNPNQPPVREGLSQLERGGKFQK